MEYVRDASWDKLLQYTQVPDERIVACHLKSENSVISYSDDQFNTTHTIFLNGWGYFQTPHYMFILSRERSEEKGYTLMHSQAVLDEFKSSPIELPLEQLMEHSYTILDSSDGQIFISVSHSEMNQRLTNIYVSDQLGFRFTLSLLNNVRSLDSGNCDFEKILGLEGVYIANVYDH